MFVAEDPIQLRLTGMAHGGFAFGHHEGQVIFVPYAIPGETVLAQVETQKRGWARAHLVEVIEPSPDRVEAGCPHFGASACGGCQWQHIAYPAQLRYKTEVVRDQLGRLAGLTQVGVQPTRVVGDPLAYRNHVQLRAAPDGLGYVAADGQRVQPVSVCPIMHPVVAELFEELDIDAEDLLTVGLRAGVRTGQQLVVFETVDDEPLELSVDSPVACVLMRSDGVAVTLVGRDYLVEEVAGHTYRVSAGSFFQVNTAGAGALIETVTAYLAPQSHQALLDAYAGVGLFSVALASQVSHVIAVEASPAAVADARYNVQTAGLDNVEVIGGDVAEALSTLDQPVQLAIVDPPRAGCGPNVVARLAGLEVERLVYVACDPATLARDAKLLTSAGYQLVEVQPLDLFPQTYHIESVALFVRNLVRPSE